MTIVRMHLKVLVEPDVGLETLVERTRTALFQSGTEVEVVTAADVVDDPAAAALVDLQVAPASSATPTPQQDELFRLTSSSWSGWVAHGAPGARLLQGPATISRNPSVCNVYAWGGDNALWQRGYWDGQWHDWGRHGDGGVLASVPTLGTMGPDHEHVFARGTDAQVWQKWWNAGAGWSGWVPLGAPAAGMVEGPVTISRNGSVCNVYVWGGDNALWQGAYYDGQWHGWGRHEDGGVLASVPALGSMGPDHEHVFVRGTDSQVWQKWWTAGSGWSGWIPLGAPEVGFVGAPATVSRNSTVCNLYVRGTDDALWQRAYHDGEWHPWATHGDPGVLDAVPAPGAPDGEHEHVFVRGADDQVWQKWWLGPTRDQELVVFFVGSPTSPEGPVEASSVHPEGLPGVVVASTASEWALARALGELLGVPQTAVPEPAS